MTSPADLDARVAAWFGALEARHLATLRFAEVSRALRALSSAYVERRDRLAHGVALDGGGKRAAFALFYGPLHFLAIRAIVEALPTPAAPPETVVDLGCGSGASGAAWAIALQARPRLVGIDRHRWAVSEAGWTYRTLGLRGRTAQGDGATGPIPERRAGLLAGYFVNELADGPRAALLERLARAARHGASVLIVEPIARSATPWWAEWADRVADLGGRADEWRLAVSLPSIVQRLDRAAGLSHRELTARSLYVPASAPREP